MQSISKNKITGSFVQMEVGVLCKKKIIITDKVTGLSRANTLLFLTEHTSDL